MLKETLALHGKPEIFNIDQGSQFTSHGFQHELRDPLIQISMDGKGHALTTFTLNGSEGRSLKYEHVYLQPAEDGLGLFNGIQVYINFYNKERRHQSLGHRTPAESFTQLAAWVQTQKRSKKEKGVGMWETPLRVSLIPTPQASNNKFI